MRRSGVRLSPAPGSEDRWVWQAGACRPLFLTAAVRNARFDFGCPRIHLGIRRSVHHDRHHHRQPRSRPHRSLARPARPARTSGRRGTCKTLGPLLERLRRPTRGASARQAQLRRAARDRRPAVANVRRAQHPFCVLCSGRQPGRRFRRRAARTGAGIPGQACRPPRRWTPPRTSPEAEALLAEGDTAKCYREAAEALPSIRATTRRATTFAPCSARA